MSSQKYIQKFSKGASRFKDLLWEFRLPATLLMLTFAGVWVFRGFSDAVQVLWIMCWGAIVYILVDAPKRRKLIDEKEKLEYEIDSFPATEFMEGMNAFGVETLLGGGDPFGPQADIRLRFPATQLQKHLVDAMVDGLETALRKNGQALSDLDRTGARVGFEHKATKWIEEMTKGLR